MIHHVLRNLTSLLQYTTNNKRVYIGVYSGRPHLKKGMTRTHEVGWLVWRFSNKGPQKMGIFCWQEFRVFRQAKLCWSQLEASLLNTDLLLWFGSLCFFFTVEDNCTRPGRGEMGHEQHVARITTNPEACITMLLRKSDWFLAGCCVYVQQIWLQVQKSSSTTGTGSRVEIGFDWITPDLCFWPWRCFLRWYSLSPLSLHCTYIAHSAEAL